MGALNTAPLTWWAGRWWLSVP